MQEVKGNAECTTCDSGSRQTVHTISKTLYVSTISYAYVKIEGAVTWMHSLLIQQLSTQEIPYASWHQERRPKFSLAQLASIFVNAASASGVIILEDEKKLAAGNVGVVKVSGGVTVTRPTLKLTVVTVAQSFKLS